MRLSKNSQRAPTALGKAFSITCTNTKHALAMSNIQTNNALREPEPNVFKALSPRYEHFFPQIYKKYEKKFLNLHIKFRTYYEISFLPNQATYCEIKAYLEQICD